MVKKCCVYGCATNYASKRKKKKESDNLEEESNGEVVDNNENKIAVYRFPKEENERERWVKIVRQMNLNLTVTNETVICEKHWPKCFEKIKVYGKYRPKNPPSVWEGIPKSQTPTMPPPMRTTKRASSSIRSRKEDELTSFVEKDRTTFKALHDELLINNTSERFVAPVTVFVANSALYVQSQQFLHGTPKFLVKILENLRFETFHCGVKCYITSLSKNYVTTLDSWSKLEECIRFLNSMENDNKKDILQQQITAMAPQTVGVLVYGPEVIVRAFEYFATSRSLYNRLRNDYQLPSITTLTRITSKVSKVSENTFLNGVFRSLGDKQKLCIVLHDEVYVKKMLLYHGGSLFGKSVDDPTTLARTILGIMVVCLYGGPKFLSKMLPVSKLNSKFLIEQVEATTQSISTGGGTVKAIVCDGNRTNQAFFKRYITVEGKPWLTQGGIFLLFDFVHILKNIRNLWLTEKMGELVFEDNGIKRTAKWCHLKQLYELDSKSLVQMSKLTEVSIFPKPIERQKVSTCLRVFCDATYHALLNHPGMAEVEGINDTAIFIQKIITWWKIMNVKALGADTRHNDPLQAVIRDPADSRLQTILEFGDMALKMAGKQGNRVKQLSKDTSVAIHRTCYGVVALCKHLLETTHQYVCLGKFTTDFLEKEFCKIRQGSGGTYFISVQQVIEKVHIKQSSLLLSLDVDIGAFNVESGHQCTSCSYLLCEEGSETFDNLPELESSIPLDTKMSLVYIAGYVTRKDTELTEDQLLDLTTFYYQKYGKFTESLDRGGLKIPSDCSCQWTFFCFVIFNTIKDKVCRKSLCNIFMLISEFYSFDIQKHHGMILSNIFLKNYCLNVTPRSGKEPALKVLKLS